MSSRDERFLGRADQVRNAGVIKFAGGAATPKASFQRPSDTNQYTTGTIVLPANMAAMQFAAARVYATSFLIVKARLWKSSPNLVGAAFMLHLFSAQPTPANPDGGTFSCDQSRSYIGSLDLVNLRTLADGAAGSGSPTEDGPICVELPEGQTVIYGLLEARGTYTPVADEQFEVTLELQQD